MNFFLSYSSLDKDFVALLRQALRKVDINPIETNLKSTIGYDIIDWLDRILPPIDYVIVVFSKAYNEDPWFATELAAFVGKEMSIGYKLILPVVIEDCRLPDLFAGRIAADFRGRSFDSAIGDLFEFIAKRRQVFVVMNFGEGESGSAFEAAVRDVSPDFGYAVIRVDKIQDSGVVTAQILREISKSELVVADLTSDNPNCYYEVGYAQALGKTIILTKQRLGREAPLVPFDLSGNRFIFWKNELELREGLRKRFEAIQSGTKRPVVNLARL